MYINAIYDADLQNGEGVGVTLCVSGCHTKCKGCFNPEAQNPAFGKEYTSQHKQQIINMIEKDYIDHLAIIGGEPLTVDKIKDLSQLCWEAKTRFPQKKIWLWSGYLWENIYNLAYGANQHIDITIPWCKNEFWTIQDKLELQDLLESIDVLVDGPFIQEQKDLTLKWRGSKNQRVISVQTTLNHGLVSHPVLYCE